MNINPTYPLFPVFAFLGFLLVLIPLPWHFQAWNAGTCAYMIWASVACLVEFVNSIVWRNNALNVAPVWCDISSKVLLGAGVGIPAAGLCISRRLYVISTIRSTVVTTQDKRRALIIDLCIAVGTPLIVMALHYVVQGHRFDILEDVGCWPSIYNTLPAYFLVFMWPLLLGCISFVFSALTLQAFYRRRLEFNHLITSHSSLNFNRYVRLMMLAVSEMLCTIPISICSLYISAHGIPLEPWISWANVHYGFSYVGQIPAVEWMSNPNYRTSVELTRWLFPASALLFFLFFGFASEARKNYYAVFLFVAKRLGHMPAADALNSTPQRWKSNLNKSISVGSSPVYATPALSPVKRANSCASSTAQGSDIDVEKFAHYLSSRLSTSSPWIQHPLQPASADLTNDISYDNAVDSTTMARPSICSHNPPLVLPYQPPVTNPPLRTYVSQDSQPLNHISITVQS